jgi:hypothetical protein
MPYGHDPGSDRRDSIRSHLPARRETRLQRRPYLKIGSAVKIQKPDRVRRRACIPQKQVLRPVAIEIADGLDLGTRRQFCKHLA